MATSRARSSQSFPGNLHLELGAHQFPPCDASGQTPQTSRLSLDYTCLPVCLSHYLYNVSMDMGGVLLGEEGASGGGGDIATLLYVCFPPLPHSLAIFFDLLDKRLKTHRTNTDRPADKEHTHTHTEKKAMLNVGIFL